MDGPHNKYGDAKRRGERPGYQSRGNTTVRVHSRSGPVCGYNCRFLSDIDAYFDSVTHSDIDSVTHVDAFTHVHAYDDVLTYIHAVSHAHAEGFKGLYSYGTQSHGPLTLSPRARG